MKPLSEYILDPIPLDGKELRFTIAKVWYCFLADYHGGQWSRSYARLCKLMKSYRPCQRTKNHGYDSLSKIEKRIYKRLVLKHQLEFLDSPNELTMEQSQEAYTKHWNNFYGVNL